MNPFERFELSHLSASSLNCYMEEPAYWALVYLHKYRDEAGAAAWRGSAVEAGLDHWLFKRDLPAASQAALIRFELDAMGEADDKTEKERQLITKMLEQACLALQTYPEPTVRQFKIEHWFDGIEIPLIGFVDYEFGDRGIDLKTTRRMPTEMWPRHSRQLALYAAARGKPYSALYVTDKRHDIKSVDSPATHVKRLEWSAHSIRRLLSVFPDKHDAARIFAPNFESFYWNPMAIEAAKGIWDDCR